MNLDSINPSVERRTLFRLALQGVTAFAAQGILGDPSSVHPANIAWDLKLERDVERFVEAGEYTFLRQGDEGPLISAIKDLRRHFVDGRNPELAPVLASISERWGVTYDVKTLGPMERLVTCSHGEFLAFQDYIANEADDIKKQKQRAQADEISKVLHKHPLQYVTSCAVGFILGVESHEPGDLIKILGRHITHHFSPKRPNTPNHHISFSGVVAGIHCILSGKIVE